MAGFVQGASAHTGNGTSVVVSFTNPVTTGNCLALAVVASTAVTLTISDSQSNTYTQDLNGLQETNFIYAYHLLNATGGSSFSITVSSSSTVALDAVAQEFNTGGTAVQDKFASTRGASAGSTTTGASVTTTNANDIIVGALNLDTGSGTLSAGSGYSNITASPGTGQNIAMESKLVTSTGANAPTFGVTAAGQGSKWEAVTWAFEYTNTATSPHVPFRTMSQAVKRAAEW